MIWNRKIWSVLVPLSILIVTIGVFFFTLFSLEYWNSRSCNPFRSPFFPSSLIPDTSPGQVHYSCSQYPHRHEYMHMYFSHRPPRMVSTPNSPRFCVVSMQGEGSVFYSLLLLTASHIPGGWERRGQDNPKARYHLVQKGSRVASS